MPKLTAKQYAWECVKECINSDVSALESRANFLRADIRHAERDLAGCVSSELEGRKANIAEMTEELRYNEESAAELNAYRAELVVFFKAVT